MDNNEFHSRVKRYAKRNGLDCRFEPTEGKGSHGRLYLGSRFTTLKRGEIGPGLLSAMLRQLGIQKKDF